MIVSNNQSSPSPSKGGSHVSLRRQKADVLGFRIGAKWVAFRHPKGTSHRMLWTIGCCSCSWFRFVKTFIASLAEWQPISTLLPSQERSKQYELERIGPYVPFTFAFSSTYSKLGKITTLLVASVFSSIKDWPTYPENPHITILIHDIQTSTSPSIQYLYVWLCP
jgi:hypothetical protein